MPSNRPVVRTLGEVALRCENLALMRDFYENVVGLEFWRSFAAGCFFRIGPDYGGHTQVLGLFDRSDVGGYQGVGQERTPLDHLAFTIDILDLAAEKPAWKASGCR